MILRGAAGDGRQRVGLADLLLALSLCAATWGELFIDGLTPRAAGLELPIAAAVTLPCVLRRRAPVIAVILAGGFYAGQALVHPVPQVLGEPVSQLVVVYAVAAYAPLRPALAAGVYAATAWVLVDQHEYDLPTALAETLYLAAAFIVGRQLHHRDWRAVRAENRATQIVEAQDERMLQVIAEERRRIARELHDIVAHGISIIVLQAIGGRRSLASGTELARSAFEDIEEVAAVALTDMRQLLVVLTVNQTDASREPTAGLRDLPALLERTRAAGLPVTISMDNAPDALSTGVEVSAYRIVQEALTNALKHGPRRGVDVTITHGSSLLDLLIRDRGTKVTDEEDIDTAGRGLIGMKERVDLFGGTLAAGREPNGDFNVHVTLPLSRARS